MQKKVRRADHAEIRKVQHVPLPLLAVIMAAILFAELARCEREGAKDSGGSRKKVCPAVRR